MSDQPLTRPSVRGTKCEVRFRPAYECSRMNTGLGAGGGVWSCMTPEQLRSVLPFAKFPTIIPPLQSARLTTQLAYYYPSVSWV
jgi:hypothetical protein